MSQSSKTEVSRSENPHASLPEHVNRSRDDLDSQTTGNGQTATMSSSSCQTIASSPTFQNQGDITSSFQLIQPGQDSNSSARRRKQHTCKHCGKTVSHLGHLKEHERIHTGEKPYHCKQCGKGFGRSYLLVRHERLHTGEKPFQCKVCEKSFVQLSSLKAHQSLHTGEKPYRCERCDKRFAQLSNLKAHRRVHTGEKPFVCTQCDKGFTRQDYLAGHQRLLHATGKDLSAAVNGSVARVSVSESFLPCTPPERSSSILNVVTVS